MSFVARRAALHAPLLDKHQKRHAWRRLAEAALRLANRAIASDGAETIGADELKDDLARTGKLKWEEAGDYGAAAANAAFTMIAQATLQAGTERRRAIFAGALAGLSKALDELITDQADREADQWKRQTGES